MLYWSLFLSWGGVSKYGLLEGEVRGRPVYCLSGKGVSVYEYGLEIGCWWRDGYGGKRGLRKGKGRILTYLDPNVEVEVDEVGGDVEGCGRVDVDYLVGFLVVVGTCCDLQDPFVRHSLGRACSGYVVGVVLTRLRR